jgi:hypothetical protein
MEKKKEIIFFLKWEEKKKKKYREINQNKNKNCNLRGKKKEKRNGKYVFDEYDGLFNDNATFFFFFFLFSLEGLLERSPLHISNNKPF